MSRSAFGLLALCLCSIRGGSSSSVPCTKRIYVIRHGEKIYHADDPMRTVFECLNQKGWARAYNLKSLFGHGGPLDTPDAIFSANYADELNVTGGTVAGKNCRDANGWQRTTQLIAPLSQNSPGGLNIGFDNTTGFMPQFCGQRIAPKRLCKIAGGYPNLVSEDGGCCPYGAVAEGVSAAETAKLGACCNPHAAAAIKAKLAEPEICTVLVAWESKNIEFLSAALGVPGDKGKWVYNEDQYDRFFKIEYDANLDFRSFTVGMQGFGKESEIGRDPWLGPSSGCGAIVPPAHQGLPHLGVGAAHVLALALPTATLSNCAAYTNSYSAAKRGKRKGRFRKGCKNISGCRFEKTETSITCVEDKCGAVLRPSKRRCKKAEDGCKFRKKKGKCAMKKKVSEIA